MSGEIATKIQRIQEALSEAADKANIIDEKAYGWKSNNKRLRKTIQAAREELKSLRQISIDLEKQ